MVLFGLGKIQRVSKRNVCVCVCVCEYEYIGC
jgi:hypothetical protein